MTVLDHTFYFFKTFFGMNMYIKTIFWNILISCLLLPTTFAVSTVLGEVDQDKLRNGYFSINDIPGLIKGAINFFMGLAGTISIIFIIIGAYYIMFGDIA
jgi:hypothetical protein